MLAIVAPAVVPVVATAEFAAIVCTVTTAAILAAAAVAVAPVFVTATLPIQLLAVAISEPESISNPFPHVLASSGKKVQLAGRRRPAHPRYYLVVREQFAELRYDVWQHARRMWEAGLVVGSSGNVSARANDRVAITPTQITYEEMSADQIVIVDLATGRTIDSRCEPSY